MANLTPTNLLLGFEAVNEEFQKPEFRVPNTAALSTAIVGKQNLNPFAELRTREDRATWFDFQISKADEGKTERLFDHSGGSMDSLRRQISWGTVVDTFSISEKQCDNNSHGFAGVFQTGIKNSIQKNLVKFDNAFLALLKADVTQINLGGLSGRGSWDAANNIFQILNSQKDYMMALIEANMNNNDYNEQLIALVDSLLFIDAMKQMNQGAGNATNLAYQFGNTNLVKTSKQLYSGFDGSAIVFPAGMVGLTTWIPKQNRGAIDEERAMTNPNGDVGNISIPIYDQEGNVMDTLDAAISIYTKRADTSARNGNKQDMLTEVEVSWDYAYLSAPLSAARATGDFAGKTDSVVYAYGVTEA